MNDDESILMAGDHMMPVSLDEYIKVIERDNQYHAMKLKLGLATYTRFREYLHNPMVELECCYDMDTDEYVFSVKPIGGAEFQQAINEKMGIK